MHIYMAASRLSCSKQRLPQGGRLEVPHEQATPINGSPWRAPCVPRWSAHGQILDPTRRDRGQAAELQRTCFFLCRPPVAYD